MRMALTLSDPRFSLRLHRRSSMAMYAQIALDKIGDWVGGLAGSAVVLEVVRRWFNRRRERQKAALELDVRVYEEGAALRHEAYERMRVLEGELTAERDRRHTAELAAQEARLRQEIQSLQIQNEALKRRLQRAGALLDSAHLPHPDADEDLTGVVVQR